ncbi:hypothetical protein [Streptomyces sp. NPDC006739]|uniref:hypothetical protein n=1 Tax=Streptomyces sp. NPDC006739 TaxID=3364763 RepID=UPI0036BA2E39
MSARARLERICGPQIPPELITELDTYRAEVRAEVRREDAVRLLAERARYVSREIFCQGITHAAQSLQTWADQTGSTQ